MAEIAILRPPPARTLQALTFWHEVICRSMASLPYDLSNRQLGIFLTIYLEPGAHSVKHLSERLGISKPAVCRALDVLEQLKFVRRQRDKADKRNVLLQRTARGSAYLAAMADIIVSVSRTH
ncbi:MAG: MarR family transcriptional regulator [Alphaproteobacteria bacterium]|nr:MarR family transcriptional regulator [Alphaproteobacteria bacterium]